jgi:nicotinamidase/pyrazinamidase
VATMLPAFYDPTKIGQIYMPDLQQAYEAGVAAFKQPSSDDKPRVLALLVDMQIDFVFPAPVGQLPVPNALDDARRLIEWLFANVHNITHIAASIDTHTPFHIFYSTWWKNAQGIHPAPYTVITGDEVRQGKWIPITEVDWSIGYVDQLEKVGRKQLMIWPFHCMQGSIGNALVPALSEAIMYHSAARMAQPTYLVKGTIAHTEFYSMLEPEVKYDQHPDGGLNTRFLEMLMSFDLIYVAGEARSHCVLETVNSMMRNWRDQPDLIKKLRFLDDCTSSITGFEEQTEAQFKRFSEQGLRSVRSTEPIG